MHSPCLRDACHKGLFQRRHATGKAQTDLLPAVPLPSFLPAPRLSRDLPCEDCCIASHFSRHLRVLVLKLRWHDGFSVRAQENSSRGSARHSVSLACITQHTQGRKLLCHAACCTNLWRWCPPQILRENKRSLDKSIRELDRERAALESQEKKLIADIKKMAKQDQMSAVRVMAKDLIRTRHSITKSHGLKSQLQGVSLRMQTLNSTQAMADAMKCAPMPRLRPPELACSQLAQRTGGRTRPLAGGWRERWRA